MKVLRSRLYERARQEQEEKLARCAARSARSSSARRSAPTRCTRSSA